MLSDPRFSVIHISHSEPNSLTRLACRVFELALRDCGLSRYHGRVDRRVQRDAVDFLTNDGEAFRFWCQVLDRDPNIVRSELKKRLVGS